MLVSMLAVSSWAVAAGGAYTLTKGYSIVTTPWTPEIVAAIDAYVPSPVFNGGHFYLDHFAAPTNADVAGGLTAQMSNGDIVMAGLVPDFGGSRACNNGTVLCNIGLVRYNASGVRLAWPHAGAYGHNGNTYLIYPGEDFGGGNKYQYIRDIKIRNNVIYVMVDIPDPTGGLGRQNVRVVAFNTDGFYHFNGLAGVFGYGSNAGDNEDFYGAQMVFLSNNKMIVTATTYSQTNSYLSVNRLSIASDGTLAQDQNWGAGYGGDTANRIVRYESNVPYTVWYATNQAGLATQNDFYVASSADDQGDFEIIVEKISGLTGDRKLEFDGGYQIVNFQQPNSNRNDYPGGLYVYQNDVYVAAGVAQKCSPGIGLAKLNGATGLFVSTFGGAGTGKIVFGGEGNVPLCSSPNADIPTAISATGGRIGITGYHHFMNILNQNFYDPILAVVDATNGGGTVLDNGIHPLTRADGSRYGDAVMYSIFGGPNGSSPFTVAGVGRDAQNGNTQSYAVGRFIPSSSDRIFANNFGIGDDH